MARLMVVRIILATVVALLVAGFQAGCADLGTQIATRFVPAVASGD